MGCTCSAMKTTPKLPSPICSSSLYGPRTLPGRSSLGVGRSWFRGPRHHRHECCPAPRGPSRSSSTRARSSVFPPQASSTNAGRWSAGRSMADRKIRTCLVFDCAHGVPRRRIASINQCDVASRVPLTTEEESLRSASLTAQMPRPRVRKPSADKPLPPTRAAAAWSSVSPAKQRSLTSSPRGGRAP